MKNILHFLAEIALLPVSGCIFPRNRDPSEDGDGPEGQPQVTVAKEGPDQLNATAEDHSKYQPPATASTGP
jgi:hypothetical protein